MGSWRSKTEQERSGTENKNGNGNERSGMGMGMEKSRFGNGMVTGTVQERKNYNIYRIAPKLDFLPLYIKK